MIRSQRPLIVIAMIAIFLTACGGGDIAPDVLFPPQVGEFLRTSGPAVEPETGVDTAAYQGPAGSVALKVRRVGTENVQGALDGLPPNAADITADPGLGPREGVFFTFAGEYHAAWGNGDRVFILSASTDEARRNFLNSYEY